MNSCLQCGKEIPEGQKFCSRSCSATYNNLKREGRKWSKEARKAFSDRQKERLLTFDRKGNPRSEKEVFEKLQRRENICPYCGLDINGKKICSDCKKYVTRLTSYIKAGLVKGPLRERHQAFLDILEKEHRDGLWITEICRKYGLHDVTVRAALKERNLDLYSSSEVQLRMLEQGKVQLRIGSPKFRTGEHISWKGERFRYRSSYEEAYAKQLDSQKISYRYEPFRIRYFDTQKQKERVAVPDFYLPETNELVEVKSKYTYDPVNMNDRFKEYQKRGYRVKLLLDHKEYASVV